MAARHLERRADAADRDEAELPHGGGVARARDVDGAEPLERRPARLPVAERQQRMDGAAGAVLLDRPLVRGDRLLGGGQQLAGRARSGRSGRRRGTAAASAARRRG